MSRVIDYVGIALLAPVVAIGGVGVALVAVLAHKLWGMPEAWDG